MSCASSTSNASDSSPRSVSHPVSPCSPSSAFKKSTDDPVEVRRERNRQSAARSRQRQLKRLRDLQTEVERLKKENDRLEKVAQSYLPAATDLAPYPLPLPCAAPVEPLHPVDVLSDEEFLQSVEYWVPPVTNATPEEPGETL